jgi:hypothetical protein
MGCLKFRITSGLDQLAEKMFWTSFSFCSFFIGGVIIVSHDERLIRDVGCQVGIRNKYNAIFLNSTLEVISLCVNEQIFFYVKNKMLAVFMSFIHVAEGLRLPSGGFTRVGEAYSCLCGKN